MKYVVPEVFKPLWSKQGRYKAAWGGRGSAKSWNFAAMMIVRAATSKGFRAVCVREVQKSLKESAHRLLADTIERLNFGSIFEIQSSQIKTPGGGVISFVGMQDHTADTIKSYENYSVAWCEEAQTLSSRSIELLRPTIRAPGSELWFSWNPRNSTDAIEKLLRGSDIPENAIIVKSNYSDNKFFPAELEAERLHDLKNSPDRYSHVWNGDFEPQAIGAIWTRQIINDNRRDEYPDDIERILVAVDPAVSDTERSDEHGIVVVGIDAGGHGYVLEDASLHGSPHQWALRAVAMYDKWEADGVVIEKNQGGDMCRHTLQTVRKGLPIIEVHATRGKHVRAEPISALYSVNRISHVGMFPELEDQLCLFTSSGWEGGSDKSPDRAEALIWACSELFPAMTTEKSPPQEYFNYSEAGGWMG